MAMPAIAKRARNLASIVVCMDELGGTHDFNIYLRLELRLAGFWASCWDGIGLWLMGPGGPCEDSDILNCLPWHRDWVRTVTAVTVWLHDNSKGAIEEVVSFCFPI